MLKKILAPAKDKDPKENYYFPKSFRKALVSARDELLKLLDLKEHPVSLSRELKTTKNDDLYVTKTIYEAVNNFYGHLDEIEGAYRLQSTLKLNLIKYGTEFDTIMERRSPNLNPYNARKSKNGTNLFPTCGQRSYKASLIVTHFFDRWINGTFEDDQSDVDSEKNILSLVGKNSEANKHLPIYFKSLKNSFSPDYPYIPFKQEVSPEDSDDDQETSENEEESENEETSTSEKEQLISPGAEIISPSTTSEDSLESRSLSEDNLEGSKSIEVPSGQETLDSTSQLSTNIEDKIVPEQAEPIVVATTVTPTETIAPSTTVSNKPFTDEMKMFVELEYEEKTRGNEFNEEKYRELYDKIDIKKHPVLSFYYHAFTYLEKTQNDTNIMRGLKIDKTSEAKISYDNLKQESLKLKDAIKTTSELKNNHDLAFKEFQVIKAFSFENDDLLFERTCKSILEFNISFGAIYEANNKSHSARLAEIDPLIHAYDQYQNDISSLERQLNDQISLLKEKIALDAKSVDDIKRLLTDLNTTRDASVEIFKGLTMQSLSLTQELNSGILLELKEKNETVKAQCEENYLQQKELLAKKIEALKRQLEEKFEEEYKQLQSLVENYKKHVDDIGSHLDEIKLPQVRGPLINIDTQSLETDEKELKEAKGRINTLVQEKDNLWRQIVSKKSTLNEKYSGLSLLSKLDAINEHNLSEEAISKKSALEAAISNQLAPIQTTLENRDKIKTIKKIIQGDFKGDETQYSFIQDERIKINDQGWFWWLTTTIKDATNKRKKVTRGAYNIFWKIHEYEEKLTQKTLRMENGVSPEKKLLNDIQGILSNRKSEYTASSNCYAFWSRKRNQDTITGYNAISAIAAAPQRQGL